MEVFFEPSLTAVSVVEHDDKQQSVLGHHGFIMVMLIMIVKIRMICLISSQKLFLKKKILTTLISCST